MGRKLVLLSDFHVGMPGAPRSTSRRAIRRAIAEQPAAVLLAGDFIHDTANSIAAAVELLRPLVDAGISTYAVLGNHDYAMPTKEDAGDPQIACRLEAALEEAGVPVLHNEIVDLRLHDGEGPLYLVGIGAHTAGDDKPRAALRNLPEGAPRVLLMHHPASFDECPAGTAPIALAGHTHGGQIRLPFAPLLRYFTYQKDLKVLVSGWIRSDGMKGYGRPGNSLYVTRGLGCSVVPLRLFCLPELTVLTLRAPAEK